MSSVETVTHASQVVDLYVARLLPPWFNLTIPVQGADGTLVASFSVFMRRKLRSTLREAGFEVREHLTWTYRGFRWFDAQ